MRSHNFQIRVTTGRLTLPAALFLSAACWLASALLLPAGQPEAVPATGLWQSLGTDGWPAWLSQALSFLLHGVAGWMLIGLNNTFAIIRMRASVQTAFYLLFVAACPLAHWLHAGNAGTIAALAALYFLFDSYQRKQPEGRLFHAFALLGLGSLAVPQLLGLVPVFWIGAYNFRALRFKSFCASLLGVCLPYWFLLGHAYFHGQMELFCLPFRELAHIEPWAPDYRPDTLAVLGYLFVLYVAASGHCLATGFEDKIRTRSYLHFLILLNFCLFTFIAWQPGPGTGLFPLLLAGNAFLAGHLFALTSSRASNLFFIAMLALLFLLFGFNVWTQWQIP